VDDILLFASKITELQLFLHQCQLQLAWLDLCIKSCCMRIGNRFDIDCANITSLDGTPLPWVREQVFSLLAIASLNIRWIMRRERFIAQPMPYGNVARVASEKVVLHLVKSKCYSVFCMGLRHAH